jgi:hypothetical protein
LLCFHFFSGYFKQKYVDDRAEVVNSAVDVVVTDMILKDINPQQEKAFRSVFDAWFFKDWCPIRSPRTADPSLRSELKGLLMVVAVACMNVSDPYGDDQVQLVDVIEYWRSSEKYESAYQIFATILFGVAESEVRRLAYGRKPFFSCY